MVRGRKHPYGFNGQEYTEDLSLNVYEMDLRRYDPAIARWTSIDPIAHYSNSTYNGFDNNPVFWTDPSGGSVEQIAGGTKYTGADAKVAFLNLRKQYGGSSNNSDNESQSDDGEESPNDWYLDLKQGKVVWQDGSGDQYGKIWLGGKGTSTQSLLNRLGLLGFDACFCKKSGDALPAIYADTEAAYQQFAKDNNKEALWQTLLLFNDMHLIFGGGVAGSFGRNLPTYKRFNYTPRYSNVQAGETVYGYFGMGANGVEYVGISNNPAVRFKAHGRATDGKQFLRYTEQRSFNSRLNARIWEQQKINDFGKNNLLNRRNEIRPSLWSKYNITN